MQLIIVHGRVGSGKSHALAAIAPASSTAAHLDAEAARRSGRKLTQEIRGRRAQGYTTLVLDPDRVAADEIASDDMWSTIVTLRFERVVVGTTTRFSATRPIKYEAPKAIATAGRLWFDTVLELVSHAHVQRSAS